MNNFINVCHIYFKAPVFTFHFGIYLVVDLLGHGVSICSIQFFFQILYYQFTFMPEKQVNCPFAPYSLQSVSRVQLFATSWTAACQASLSITNSWSLLKLLFIDLVIASNHLLSRWMSIHPSSVVPFSGVQSFPASGSFQMSQFFPSGGQSIGASTSVLPVNIQH